MALSDKDAGVGVVSNPNLGASHVIDGIDAIPSRRADGLDLTSPTFIKMDAEGFEPRILDGAAQTIKGAKPVMLIEVNRGALARYGYTPDDIYSRVIDLGYSFRNIHEESGLNHEQLDILCLP